MTIRGGSAALAVGVGVGLGVVGLSASWGQALPTSAKVDTAKIELTDPDRYQTPAVLEPVRRVTLVATADAVVRSQDAKAGASVREGQEVAQLDRGEAAARLKIAQAEVKEARAALAGIKSAPAAHAGPPPDVAQARVEAAEARAELAQIALDRCALRAPFAGRVTASPVSDGQYVPKGAVVAELADVSSLKVLVPVRRAGAAVGGAVSLTVEGQPVAGKISALVPLPESLAVLRELASPYTAAWVVVPNTAGAFEPGERALSPDLPVLPLADVPAHALKPADDKARGQGQAADAGAAGTLQVIRNEYVTDVKVRVLGKPGPDRLQVTGALRPTDALIVSSTVPLLAGTLIRFNPGATAGTGTVEATSPNPAESGATADLTPPRTTARPSIGPAPIGAPGSAAPAPRAKAAARPPANTNRPAAKAGGASVPF